jgi:peptidyl-prolyl cis-trans isomerase A (cyclophilin A)
LKTSWIPLIACFSLLLASGCATKESKEPTKEVPVAKETPAPETKTVDKTEKNEKKKIVIKETKKEAPVPIKTKKGKTVFAIFETNKGTFKAKLFPDKAPKTVENFIALAEGKKKWTDPKTGKQVEEPLYNGTIFHRVIPKFMIQGGDPEGTGMGGPGYQFADEFDPSLRFDKVGLLAMANAGPGTNGSQFFVTVEKTPWLNDRHTIFGEVVSGYEVVEKISTVPSDPRNNKPNEDVVLKSVKIEQK